MIELITKSMKLRDRPKILIVLNPLNQVYNLSGHPCQVNLKSFELNIYAW